MKTKTGPNIFKVRNSQKKSNSESFSESNIKLNEHLQRFTWLPQPCCPRFPLELLLKIVVPIIGLIIEVFLVVKTPPGGRAYVALVDKPFHIWNDDGTLDTEGIKKPYHATVYGVVLLSGIVDILVMLVNFPRQTSPLFLFFAFLVEEILFFFHIKGQTPIEAHIHTVLATIVFACIIFSLVRMFNGANFFINLGLGCSIILLGMWFFQTGYLRNYSHQYHLISDVNITTTQSPQVVNMFRWYITACFAWMVIAIATSMIILWMVLLCVQRGLQQCCGSPGRFKWIKARDFVTLLTRVQGYKKVVLENSQADENESLIISFDSNIEQTPQPKRAGAMMSDVLESSCPIEDEEEQSSNC